MKTYKALSAFEQCALQEDNARLRAALAGYLAAHDAQALGGYLTRALDAGFNLDLMCAARAALAGTKCA